MIPATEVVAEGREQLEQRLEVAAERSLAGGPGFGMGERLEDPPAMARRPHNHALVDQEEKNGGRMPERHARPVVGPAEVVFEMKPDVTGRFFKERRKVLVVAMGPVVNEPPGPGITESAGDWFNHGMPGPQKPLVVERPNPEAPISLLDYYNYPDKAQVAKIRLGDERTRFNRGPGHGR